MRGFQPSLRDFGNTKQFPVLKRRAIVIASLRDDQTPPATVVHPKIISGMVSPPNLPSESAACQPPARFV
jgi:hypothetical protein